MQQQRAECEQQLEKLQSIMTGQGSAVPMSSEEVCPSAKTDETYRPYLYGPRPYLGHNCIGYDYIGRDYRGHNCVCHNYIGHD